LFEMLIARRERFHEHLTHDPRFDLGCSHFATQLEADNGF
jgi:hypothetical protein